MSSIWGTQSDKQEFHLQNFVLIMCATRLKFMTLSYSIHNIEVYLQRIWKE